MVQVSRSDRHATAQPLTELSGIQLLGCARVHRNELAHLSDIPAELGVGSGHRQRVDLTPIDRQLADPAAAEALRTDGSETRQDDCGDHAGHQVVCSARSVRIE